MSKLAFRPISTLSLFNPIFTHLCLVFCLVNFSECLTLRVDILLGLSVEVHERVIVFSLSLNGGCLNTFSVLFRLLYMSRINTCPHLLSSHWLLHINILYSCKISNILERNSLVSC